MPEPVRPSASMNVHQSPRASQLRGECAILVRHFNASRIEHYLRIRGELKCLDLGSGGVGDRMLRLRHRFVLIRRLLARGQWGNEMLRAAAEDRPPMCALGREASCGCVALD